ALRNSPTLFPYTTLFRSMRVAFAWNNMAIAELRDLNRHRTGHRYAPCIQAGFYLAPETRRESYQPFFDRQKAFLEKLMERGEPRSEEHTSELQSRENLVC